MKRFAVQQRRKLGWVTLATASRLVVAERILLRARCDQKSEILRIIRV